MARSKEQPGRSERNRYTTKEKVFRELRCELTDDQVRLRGEEAARKRAERQKLEAEFDSVRKAHKATIDRIEAEVDVLSAEVRERMCEREVECIVRFDHALGIVETIRTDTGEVIGNRPMEASERQGVFMFDQERPDDPKQLGDGSSGPTVDL